MQLWTLKYNNYGGGPLQSDSGVMFSGRRAVLDEWFRNAARQSAGRKDSRRARTDVMFSGSAVLIRPGSQPSYWRVASEKEVNTFWLKLCGFAFRQNFKVFAENAEQSHVGLTKFLVQSRVF